MSESNIISFLRLVAARGDVLDSLKVRSKDEVIAAAASFGYPFDEAEFDALIWDLELKLSAQRGDAFDAHFPLWETMWGAYYLEYLVNDLVPSFEEAGILSDTRGAR